MSLPALWLSNPDQIRAYALWQIVAMAGDGKVSDGSRCCEDLRLFFGQVDEDLLERFVNECLQSPFDDSGLVLQDLANEIGRRLEFDVTPGLYRGRRGQNGCDGVWRGGGNLNFVVEVKTTDTYNAHLDQIARYRSDLVEGGLLDADSSVLFVVGRQDTGALEAQIRGSRHAWTMRVIGAASLIRLLRIKVRSESNNVVARIKSLLRPVEYTRLDGIVDLMFDAAEEAASSGGEAALPQIPGETPLEETGPRRAPSSPPSNAIDAFRERAAEAISGQLGVRLTRRRRSLFSTADDQVHAVLAVSKRYERAYQAYWYGFYDVHYQYLEEASSGYLALGALDTGKVYCLPLDFVRELLPRMTQTVREEGQMYWHIIAKLAGTECRLVVAGEEISLSPYELDTA
jgi:hypothetical protein